MISKVGVVILYCNGTYLPTFVNVHSTVPHSTTVYCRNFIINSRDVPMQVFCFSQNDSNQKDNRTKSIAFNVVILMF